MNWFGLVFMVIGGLASAIAVTGRQFWHILGLRPPQLRSKRALYNIVQNLLSNVLHGSYFLSLFTLWFCTSVVRSYLSPSSAREWYYRLKERRAVGYLSPFVYSETLSENQVRLLRFEGPHSGLLHFSLECFPLKACPSFIALSYTWANPKYECVDLLMEIWPMTLRTQSDIDKKSDKFHHRIVMCNGMALRITPNLYDSLRCVQMKHETSYWWIDQVCINQADIREKNNQIPQMGEVFGQADQVIAWLGLPGIFENGLPALLRESFAEGQGSVDVLHINRAMTARGLVFIIGLLLLLDRSWFSRAWIVQEFVLARDVTFFLGSEEIPLGCLMRADNTVQDYIRWLSLSAIVRLNRATEIFNARRTFDRSTGWTFEYWIQVCRGRRASDRRDLIFAGRSLLSASEKLRVSIDYSTDESIVFSRLTEDLLSGKSGIESVFLAERREQSQFYEEFQYPTGSSWEVNLDHQIPYDSIADTRFSADPNGKQSNYKILRDQGTTYLQTEAIIVDTVEAVCFPESLSHPTGYRGLLSILLLMGETYQWTEEHPFVALARTLTANQTTAQDEELIHSIAGMLSAAAEEAHSVHGLSTAYTSSVLPDFDEYRPQPPAYSGLHSYDLLLGLMYAFPHSAWEKPWPRVSPDATWKEMRSHRNVTNSFAIVPAEERFWPFYMSQIHGRFLFRTHKGIIGRGPNSVKPGDCVAILKGSRIPYVLQIGVNQTPEDKMKFREARDELSTTLNRLENLETYVFGEDGLPDQVQAIKSQLLEAHQAYDRHVSELSFLGEAYVHGFMNGEIQDWIDKDIVSWQSINIK